MPRKLPPLQVGTKYGSLLVVEATIVGVRGFTMATCHCACGAVVMASAYKLMSGRKKSCGCLKAERNKERATHGQSRGARKTPEYKAWECMRSRCGDKTVPEYGGRGIKVCDRWNDFTAFLNDMGPRPSPQHSIDRIDVNGDYEPGNCRWATLLEQAGNKRNTVFVEYNDQRMCLAAACRLAGINYKSACRRVQLGRRFDDIRRPSL